MQAFFMTPGIALEDIVKGENAVIPLTLLKWLVKGQRNIAITGAQNTGKITVLKSLIQYVSPGYSICVQKVMEGGRQKDSLDKEDIICEIAEEVCTNFIIQTMPPPIFELLTYHTETASDLVTAIAKNIMDPESGIYCKEKKAMEMAANFINIDVHLKYQEGHRFIDRITEIVTFYDTDDDRIFEEHQLMHCDNGEFILDDLPSWKMMEEIRRRFMGEEEDQFYSDMEMLKNRKRKVEEE